MNVTDGVHVEIFPDRSGVEIWEKRVSTHSVVLSREEARKVHAAPRRLPDPVAAVHRRGKDTQMRLINRCPHTRIRGIYGDEINHTPGFRRLQCVDCGRLLDGPVRLATE